MPEPDLTPELDASTPLLLQPGSLWTRTVAQTEYAHHCGALESLPTTSLFLEAAGIKFLVRILANLTSKETVQRQLETAHPGKPVNPFLPYEPDLFVADISATHLFLLNKFNVVDHHLLIITRAFEEQENLLNLEDFTALWSGLREFPSLGFYNAGKAAGASQRHKHLQLVPLPLSPQGPDLPIAPLLSKTQFEQTGQSQVGTIPKFSFLHGLIQLPLAPHLEPTEAAPILLDYYQHLLRAVGFDRENHHPSPSPPAYNLLITAEWMLMVPRGQAAAASIPVNALGFAGALLVRDEAQLQILQQEGPLTILNQVGIPRS